MTPLNAVKGSKTFLQVKAPRNEEKKFIIFLIGN